MNSTNEGIYDPKKELDTYTYSEKFGWIQEKLWFCAGADVALMKRCPRSEQIKEEGIGGIVLATAVLAFFSGSYAMYVVFGPKVGLALSAEQQQIDWQAVFIAGFIGFIWSLVILNIDRFVVSSTGHGDGTDKITWGEFFRALPRLVMAILIGFCLSAPLEIRVMKSEIEAQLRIEQETYSKKLDNEQLPDFNEKSTFLENKKSAAETKIKKIDESLQKRESDIAMQRKKLDDEASGLSANGRPGQGKAYEAKMKNLEEMKAELEKSSAVVTEERGMLKSELQQTVRDIELLRSVRKQQQDDNQLKASNKDGLISRIHIAHDIGGYSFWILAGLLMIIEIAPIFFKMMMPSGPYLRLLQNQNEIVLAKYGIVTEEHIKAGSTTEIETKSRHYFAETIREFEIQQLAAEQKLANLARNKFVDLVSEDIQKNPSEYLDLPVKSVEVKPPPVSY
jgi:hypothetical protein